MFGLLIVCVALAAPQSAPSPWETLRPLVGEWVGKTTGKPGAGEIQRSFKMVLNNQYLETRTKDVFEPRNGKAAEVHEDWGMINFHKARGKFLLREFHVEGFVNQYVMEVEAGSKKFVFTTENIDNIPAGWRARHTIELISKDEMKEEFALAALGKEFETYTTSVLKRKR
jgi:hypothetical protein